MNYLKPFAANVEELAKWHTNVKLFSKDVEIGLGFDKSA